MRDGLFQHAWPTPASYYRLPIVSVGTVFLAFLLLDPIENFFAVNGNIFRRIHTDPYLVSFDTQHGYRYIVTDHQGLTHSSRKYQHACNSLF
jgi:hypothetical protein